MCIYGRANTHTGGYEFMKVDFNEMEIIMIKQVMTMILAFFRRKQKYIGMQSIYAKNRG